MVCSEPYYNMVQNIVFVWNLHLLYILSTVFLTCFMMFDVYAVG